MNACDQLTYLVDVDAARATLLDGARGRHPAFTPDARALVTSAADGALLVWDLAASPARASRIDAHLLHPHAATVSADGAWIAVTGEGAVALARAHDTSARTLESDEGELLGASFDAHATALVVAGESGAWIWDLASGERRHVDVGLPLAIRPRDDGELDLIASDRRWHLRDDLPRTPAELGARLTALGYTLPSTAP
jgi:WD40 repeat protein